MTTRWWSLPLFVPIAVVAAAYGLFLLSDRLLYVGPFDRATFGWLFVVAIWLLAPVVAAIVWQRLPPAELLRVTLALGLVVGAAAGVLLWTAITTDTAGCVDGPRTSPEGLVIPALLVGALVGAAPSLAGRFATSDLVEGHPRTAVVVALATDAALSIVALALTTFAILGMAGCQRPHP